MTVTVADADGRVRAMADDTSPIRVVTDLDADAVHDELVARLTSGVT